MPSIGEAFTQTVPTVGTSGTAYASTVNAILTEVMSRLSTKVPVGSIAPAAAALDMNNQAVKLMAYAGFYDQGSAPSGAPYGRIVYADDEFYLVTPSGAIQLTSSGAINVTSVGAIGGDYGGSNPALVEFVNSTSTYEFWEDGATEVYATIKAGEVHVADQASGECVRIQPPALAGTYDLILPAALPNTGTVALLALKSDGTIQTAGTEAITEALSNGGLRHGNRTIQFSTKNEDLIAGSRSASSLPSNSQRITVGTANTILGWLISGLPTDARIKSVSFRCWKSSGGTAAATLLTQNTADGTTLTYESATSQTASGFTTVTRTCSTPLQLSAGLMLYVELLLPASTDYVMSIEVTYDKVL